MSTPEPLPYIVECKSTQAFFETIAAFNCRPAADAYAAMCGETNRSFEYRVVVPVPVIKHASLIERRIVGRLIADLLAAGYSLSIYNGGDEAELERSTDAEAIFKALAASGQDEIFAHKENERDGWIRLVWGNDIAVISDYSIRLEAAVAGANTLADELEG